MLLIYPHHEGFTAPPIHPYEFRHSESKTLRLWVVPFETGTSLNTSTLHMPENLALAGIN